MDRKTLIVGTVVVSVLAGGITSRMFASQSGRPVPMPAPKAQSTQTPAEPHVSPAEQWEYHLLTSDSQGSSVIQTPIAPLTYLDRRINELADEGWEVQSMQPVASERWHQEVIVLLRRPRR